MLDDSKANVLHPHCFLVLVLWKIHILSNLIITETLLLAHLLSDSMSLQIQIFFFTFNTFPYSPYLPTAHLPACLHLCSKCALSHVSTYDPDTKRSKSDIKKVLGRKNMQRQENTQHVWKLEWLWEDCVSGSRFDPGCTVTSPGKIFWYDGYLYPTQTKLFLCTGEICI